MTPPSFFAVDVAKRSPKLVVLVTKEAFMSTRCYALVPPAAGRAKTVRCPNAGATKLLGVSVCRPCRAAANAAPLELWTKSLPRFVPAAA